MDAASETGMRVDPSGALQCRSGVMGDGGNGESRAVLEMLTVGLPRQLFS
ncbi:MAG: hypothetical protein KDA96_16310 [Planctomycetaceae bacterium]|nr:hypothetical protein [Planctomycetaceae bacterium]